MSTPITNTEDIIDSRDIIARIEELEGELEAAHEQATTDGLTNLDFDEWVEAVLKDQSAAQAAQAAAQVAAQAAQAAAQAVAQATQAAAQAVAQATQAAQAAAQAAVHQHKLWDEFWDEAKEFRTLKEFASEAEDYCADWHYGGTLIRHTYFVEYNEQLIDDCYELPKELTSGKWPYYHIKVDYEAAAAEAEQDYTEVDFDGVTYLVR